MLQNPDIELILASASSGRASLLRGAGLEFEIQASGVDEGAIRRALETGGGEIEPGDVAEVLARAKAEAVSAARPEALVIGGDQVLALGGEIFEKPETIEAARDTLLRLKGRTHALHSAAVLARDGETVWSQVVSAHLTMRDVSPEFVGHYLAAAGDSVLTSVGAYRLESFGIQLFSEISGDYFTILGLPLLAVLEALRREGALRS